MKKWLVPVLILIVLLLAACSPAAPAAPAADETMVEAPMADDAMMDEKADDTTHDEAMADEAMADEAMMALPAWQTLPLVDATTGETFTLADFAGQTVFVEPMATWCTNCRRQLQNVAGARADLAGENVRFVALSLETNLAASDLARYTRNEGFDWTFAVMSPEILQSLADAFGRSITSAPSTPHFIIRPDGSTTELVTGIDSSAELVEMIRAAGS